MFRQKVQGLACSGLSQFAGVGTAAKAWAGEVLAVYLSKQSVVAGALLMSSPRANLSNRQGLMFLDVLLLNSMLFQGQVQYE